MNDESALFQLSTGAAKGYSGYKHSDDGVPHCACLAAHY